ncbi:hypothetical protein [Thalassospira sp.]|uniref:hypothetical protein n=1 Tax=Thalassospira sp. TaxID=1912094 RepID=UPI0025EE06D4|nr:hypothetical protein [Thalassospira sp.]
MVENEKIIKEDIKLPENILSEKEEIKIEEPNNEIKVEQQEEIKPEKNILQKVSDFVFTPVAAAEKKIFTEEQQKDFNRLLELDVKPEDAKKIILGEEVELQPLETEGKSEYEVEKQFLAKNGIDLDLIINSASEAKKIDEQIFVDSAGIETEGGHIPAKLLYELNGYKADKENEITGDIRFILGFGLDGAQFKENNIKNLLIERITKSGEYDEETLAKYLDKIEVKTVELTYEGRKKEGLVYRIPKELGGNNMFSAVDSPKLSMDDLKDAAADSAPIVASIIGGTFGSSLGPAGTVAGSAVSAGFTEYARLMYGYHKLGLQNDLYTPEEFNKVAIDMSIKYAAIDAAATGVFLAGAKLILPTILGKNQLSTKTIQEFIETEGKTNTTMFKEVNKVKDQMKKEFNFTQAEVDNYFAVSVGKAILNSDQLIKKGSAAQRALLSDNVARLEAKSAFKAIEDKILKQTTKVSEVGNKEADKIIANVTNQIEGQAAIGIKNAELALLKNTKQVAELEGSYVSSSAAKYLDEFGVTLDNVYKSLESQITYLDDIIIKGIAKNTDIIPFNVNKAIQILNKDAKQHTFKKGLFPSKLKTWTKKTSKKKVNEIKASNKLYKTLQVLNKGGFAQTGKDLKIMSEGFQVLQKTKEITLKDAVTLKNAVNGVIETLEKGVKRGAYVQLSKNINANIQENLMKSGDLELSNAFKEQLNLLNLKRESFFNNFINDFGNQLTLEGTANLRYASTNLFKKLVDTTNDSVVESMKLGDLISTGVIPPKVVSNVKEALYRNYFNKVVPKGTETKMSHSEFFSKFGKNYENILGKEEYAKLKSTQSVMKALDNALAEVADINLAVGKYLPGIGDWSALSAKGPGEIVEFILSPAFTKKNSLTKLLQALPAGTVKEIRQIFIQRMMKDVGGDVFVPTGLAQKTAQIIGGTPLKAGTLNGAKLNAFLNTNRSALLQLFDANFFNVYRSMADVLEMLQIPANLAKAADTSLKEASKNAALFIDMIYGPLNHKRLILNRAARLLDTYGLSQDNLMLFNDYGMFIEAAKKNFLAGNYPAWITKLPEKERSVFMTKALKAINKTVDFFNLGLNRGAGIRKPFTFNPFKNPLVYKEYLEDKYEEMKGEDRMQDDADIFFPIDATAKYAIKSLQAVFGKAKEKTFDKVIEAIKGAKEVEEKDIKKEKFEKEFTQ